MAERGRRAADPHLSAHSGGRAVLSCGLEPRGGCAMSRQSAAVVFAIVRGAPFVVVAQPQPAPARVEANVPDGKPWKVQRCWYARTRRGVNTESFFFSTREAREAFIADRDGGRPRW